MVFLDKSLSSNFWYKE